MLFFFVKTMIIVVTAIIIRGMLPRYRVDQAVNKNWKLIYFIYLSFIFLILTMAVLF